jgi:hypothetical protein
MLHPHTLKIACANCNLRELCLPIGLSTQEMEKLEELVTTRGRFVSQRRGFQFTFRHS